MSQQARLAEAVEVASLPGALNEKTQTQTPSRPSPSLDICARPTEKVELEWVHGNMKKYVAQPTSSPPSHHDARLVRITDAKQYTTADNSRQIPSPSPKSQSEFDVIIATSGRPYHLELSHENNAHEIQYISQSQRELDVLVDDDKSVRVTFALDDVQESKSSSNEMKSNNKSRRRCYRSSRENEHVREFSCNSHGQRGKSLYSCGLDDLDDLVDDLVSPVSEMLCLRQSNCDCSDDFDEGEERDIEKYGRGDEFIEEDVPNEVVDEEHGVLCRRLF
jgi:hypothetical protein